MSHPGSGFVITHLRSNAFFKGITESQFEGLANLAKIHDVDENASLSDKMSGGWFSLLIKGSVAVVMDDIAVVNFDKPGDVLSEISINVANTQIRAGADLQLLTLKISDVAEVTGIDEEKVISNLHKCTSQIFISALDVAKTKAEMFEKTKDSLVRLEQQNIELSATQEQLIELASIKRTALSRIEDLYQRVLPTLETKMTLLAATFGGEILRDLVGMKLEIREVIDMIKPIAEMASAEQSIRSKRVLVAEHEKKQQIIIKMAMGGSGVDMTIVSNVLEARKAFDQNKYDLIIANTENLEVLFEAQKSAREARLILIAPTEIQDYLGILESHPNITNVVSRNKEDRSFTSRIVLATVTKILSGEIFGMEKYLAWGVEVLEWRITRSDIRSELIEKMRSIFSNLGVRRSFLDRCALVSEEMLMNAIYDAPVDTGGRTKYNHIDRTELIELEEEEQGYYRIACDGSYLAVSVSDPFGSLTKDTILMYLRSCYEGNAGVYNERKGGAGRGLHQIVENADLVIFNVKKSMRTEVLCLFYLDSSSKQDSHNNSFQFFFE